MSRKTLKKSKGSYKIVLLVVLLIAMLGVAVFVTVPGFSKPSWEKIGQMMAENDPAEDSGRLVLSEEDKERISSANYQRSVELTDVSGIGASGKVSTGFESDKYGFRGEFQGLPAVSPGQSYQVWLVRDKPFGYIPAATMIVTDSASYQVEPVSGADLINWQEVAAFAVADPASYQKFLRGESQDFTERWRVEAETGIDGLGKMRTTVYYGSSTDLTGYDRVVLTQEESDGNIRPGKFILYGKTKDGKATDTTSSFPKVYSLKIGDETALKGLLGSGKCPAYETSEGNDAQNLLIICAETNEKAKQAREYWKAGRLREEVEQYEILTNDSTSSPTPQPNNSFDLSGSWQRSDRKGFVEIVHSGNSISGTGTKSKLFSGTLNGTTFSGSIARDATGCPNLNKFVQARGTVSENKITITSDSAFSYDTKKCTVIKYFTDSLILTRVQ